MFAYHVDTFFYFAGLLVVVLFTFVLIVQFLAMVVHRVGTVTHYLGRAPYRVNEAYHSSWSFNDR